jgi:hypothetical protein
LICPASARIAMGIKSKARHDNKELLGNCPEILSREAIIEKSHSKGARIIALPASRRIVKVAID